MRFDQLLHETIDEMTGQMKGPSAAFINSAMARGRRIRRRRHIAAAGVALIAGAAVVLPRMIISGGVLTPATQSTASSAPVSYPASAGLPGGWVITGAGTLVLDRASRTYVRLKGRPEAVLPAPVGNRVLINTTPDSVRVIDVRGTRPVTIDLTYLNGEFRWSPAGDRLVGQANQKEPYKIGFAVIDANTGSMSTHWIDRGNYDCSQCSFSWTRDGSEVVMAIADRSGGEAAELVSRLQLFDAATGAPTRSLPVRAMPSSPFSWSPNGRYVVANPGVMNGAWQLIDVTTGAVQPFPYDAVWVSDDQLLAALDQRVLTLRPDGTVTAIADADIPGAAGPISLGPPA